MRLRRIAEVAVEPAAFAAWRGEVVATASTTGVHLGRGEDRARFGIASEPICALDITPDGRILAAPHVLDPRTGRWRDGAGLVAAARSGLAEATEGGYRLRAAAWSPEGTVLAVALVHRQPRGILAASESPDVTARVAVVTLDAVVTVLVDDRTDPDVAILSVTDDLILAGGVSLRSWDRRDGTAVGDVGLPAGAAVLASRPGAVAVGCRDGHVVVVDRVGAVAVWSAHDDGVLATTWLPTRAVLVTGGEDDRLRVWTDGGELLAQARSPGRVGAVAAGPEGGRMLVTVTAPHPATFEFVLDV